MHRTTLRDRIERTLSLIANRDAQFQYQAQSPGLNVALELFLQWEDAYRGNTPHLADAFGTEDRAVLDAFHEIFVDIRNEVMFSVSSLDRFVDTPAWRRYRDAAAVTLRHLNTAILAA